MLCWGRTCLPCGIILCLVFFITEAVPFTDNTQSVTSHVALQKSKHLQFTNNLSRVRLKTDRKAIAPAPAASLYRNPVMDEFAAHRMVTPTFVHSRTKRTLQHTWDQGSHHNHITVGLVLDGQDILVDLHLNRDLLTKEYYEKQLHRNGSHILTRPSAEDCGMCHYQGSIQSRPRSWAALSTCHGVRGVLFDGEEAHYIEPSEDTSSITSPHLLLSHRDLIKQNHTCGYKGQPHPIRDVFHDEEFTRLLRYKRTAGGIHGPFNANALSRFVELVLVTDKAEFDKYNQDVDKLYRRCKDIANIVNALYQPLNIFVALVGVEVWKEEDQVDVSTDGDKTLTNFLNYRKVRLIPQQPNDNAQLLTGKLFDSGVVGKALKGPICTYQYSGGVNMDHSESVALVATTVAHEMGHNFGMEHDTEDCKCPDKRCIMAPSSGTKSPSHWSSCSHEYLAISFERSMDYCLRNRPTSLFESPVCGNGFVEAGEQCDCGLVEHCDNTCCNATTCMLFRNATCATGHCCDLQTCRPKSAGTECRESMQACDLAEYCSGDSEYCPDNVYKENGHDCLDGKAFCYEGTCKTHEHQCQLLWGPTGKNSHDRCYNLNLEGNTNGNCGYNWANDSYKRCDNDDIKCGMMHCKHFNERLEFGMESVSKVSHRFIVDKIQGPIPCRVAQVDLGLDMVDPGLAPDGAKCGYNKMCVNQHCKEVASMRLHTCDCHAKGVCNNKGHCHCDVGFAWPDCIYPGLGGSEDSGPASNPNATGRFVVVMFIFFLGIVPLSLLIALAYYARGNIKLWWLRKGRKATSRLNGKPTNPPTSRSHSVCVEVVGPAASKNPKDPRAETPPSSQGSKSNSPLLNGYKNAQLSTQFFGHHEGFTLSPIKDKGPGLTSPSNPPPEPPKGIPWAVPSKNAPTKVDISGPSLKASTNPAVGPNIPRSTLADPPVAVVAPCRRAPTRPLSVPDATCLVRHSPSIESESDSKEGKQSAVSRIASFLTKKDRADTPEPPQSPQCNTLPRKASKINRENLLQLEISHPMQLHATELPTNLVPVRTAPQPPKTLQIERTSPTKVSFGPAVKQHSMEDQSTDLIRIGSVREQPVTKRPFIPKFGSLRAPRPKSLPPARPSQPPPRPPLPKIPGTPESEYFYDDVLSMQRGDAPLASEECSSPQESIYATIDEESPEQPDPEPKKKSIFSRLYSKSKKKPDIKPAEIAEPLYCNIEVESQLEEQSKPEDIPDPPMAESGGLLSEIESELANREPQYMNTCASETPSSSPSPTKPTSPKSTQSNATKPRGVLSYMKKANSEDIPVVATKTPTSPKVINASKSVPSSLAGSVAAARAAAKTAPKNTPAKMGVSKLADPAAPSKTSDPTANLVKNKTAFPPDKVLVGVKTAQKSTASRTTSAVKKPLDSQLKDVSLNANRKTVPSTKLTTSKSANLTKTTPKSVPSKSVPSKSVPSNAAKDKTNKASEAAKKPVPGLTKQKSFPPDKTKDVARPSTAKVATKKTTQMPRASTAPLSRGGVLASAARGSSNVAALQQKFETEPKDTPVKVSKRPSAKK